MQRILSSSLLMLLNRVTYELHTHIIVHFFVQKCVGWINVLRHKISFLSFFFGSSFFLTDLETATIRIKQSHLTCWNNIWWFSIWIYSHPRSCINLHCVNVCKLVSILQIILNFQKRKNTYLSLILEPKETSYLRFD